MERKSGAGEQVARQSSGNIGDQRSRRSTQVGEARIGMAAQRKAGICRVGKDFGVECDVEGKAMQNYAALHAQPHRGKLGVAEPQAGIVVVAQVGVEAAIAGNRRSGGEQVLYKCANPG